MAYKKSIEDSIRLIEYLTNQNLNVHLYIIGTIEDKEISELLNNKIAGLPVTMINDDKYTKKASEMLYLADAVIATGRGIMEATLLGKPILTPAKNSNLPILINEYNFEIFFNTNFSERNMASDKCLETNKTAILKLIQEKEYFGLMADFSKSSFEKHFNTNSGIPRYLDFYKKNAESHQIKFNALSNLVFKFKTWYSFLK